mmetsp:Transcript_18546/g.45956  ORF Transcript_18546/g.45956 Transcript_18546/m.45956 type:complete len:245 (-) Transcript_18546:935-1669(-)
MIVSHGVSFELFADARALVENERPLCITSSHSFVTWYCCHHLRRSAAPIRPLLLRHLRMRRGTLFLIFHHGIISLAKHFEERRLDFSLSLLCHTHMITIKVWGLAHGILCRLAVSLLLRSSGTSLSSHTILIHFKIPWRTHEIHRWRHGKSPAVWNLKACLQKYGCRIEHKFRSWRVVISLDDNDVLVSGVFFVNCLRVMLFNKIVVFTSYEEGRNEAFVGVRNWRNVFDIDTGLFLNGASDHP